MLLSNAQRFVYIKDSIVQSENGEDSGEHGGGGHGYGGGLGDSGLMGGAAKVKDAAAEEEAARVAIKKEDDEFSKLEALFLTDLGLIDASPSKPNA